MTRIARPDAGERSYLPGMRRAYCHESIALTNRQDGTRTPPDHARMDERDTIVAQQKV
jgi:hypothetical protein